MIIGTAYLIVAFLPALIAIGSVFMFLKNKAVEFVASISIFSAIAALSSYFLIAGTNTTISIFHIYPFSEFFMMMFSIAFILVDILAFRYADDFELFSLLFFFSIVGIFAVIMANSIISIFIGVELSAITTTFMIVSKKGKRLEAGVKLFIISAIAISLFAFGLALIFPYNGSLSLTQLTANSAITGDYLIILAAVLFAISLGTEAAAFPFNFWIPDVYEGAPGYVTAMLAGINKKLAFVAILEIFFIVLIAYKAQFSGIFLILSIVTMFFGNLLAISQKNIKRMFAFSSISQAGYIMIGLAAATQDGLSSSIFQMFAHTFMIIGAFSIVLWLESKNIKTLDDYSGLNSRNKFVAISLTILMLSMAGLPPLMGFFGKFLLFSSAVESGLLILAIIGILNSFISIYYYGKVIASMYSEGKERQKIEVDRYIAIVVIVCVAIIIIFGLYPNPIISAARTVALYL